MAGNSNGWVKAASPYAPKGKLFVSLAQAKKYAKTDDPKVAYAALRELAASQKIAILMDLVNKSPQPGGQAKAGGALTPGGWASDPLAQDITATQQSLAIRKAGSPAELALRKAFLDANPDIIPAWSDGYSPIGAYNVLSDYQNNGYESINNALWGLTRSPDGYLAGYTSWSSLGSLQALALSAKSPIDMTVTRATSSLHPLYAWAQNASVGSPYVNLGFDSSSLNPDFFITGNDLQLRMNIPKGSRGLNMNAVLPTSPSSVKNEQEWLVPANSSWVVTGKTLLPNGKLEVTVDLVDQRDFAGNVVWP